MAIVTVAIPLIAVLSFSTPPRSPNLRVTSPLTINAITQDEVSTTRTIESPKVADR
jgi:hypothetical protein